MRKSSFSATNYHADFIIYINEELKSYTDEFNKTIESIYDAKRELEDTWYNYLVKFKSSTIISELVESNKKIKVLGETSEEQLFILKYNRFISDINRCKVLSKLIKTFTIYSRLTPIVYATIQRYINLELTKQIIKGKEIVLPFVGRLYAVKVPFDNTRTCWKRSNTFKKLLIQNGITPKDRQHPDGANWILSGDLPNDYFFLVKWRKNAGNLSNKGIYRFYPSSHGNIHAAAINNRVIPMDELLSMKNTGLFDKIVHIFWNYYDYGVNTYRFFKDQPNENRIAK